MPANATCLYTTLVPQVSRFMGFLPPHGKIVTADEEITVYGDFATRIAHDKRMRDSFAAALVDGSIAIKSSPGVFVYDDDASETKMLELVGGSYSWADPCWGEYAE
jgi:hypothetical protein